MTSFHVTIPASGDLTEAVSVTVPAVSLKVSHLLGLIRAAVLKQTGIKVPRMGGVCAKRKPETKFWALESASGDDGESNAGVLPDEFRTGNARNLTVFFASYAQTQEHAASVPRAEAPASVPDTRSARTVVVLKRGAAGGNPWGKKPKNAAGSTAAPGTAAPSTTPAADNADATTSHTNASKGKPAQPKRAWPSSPTTSGQLERMLESPTSSEDAHNILDLFLNGTNTLQYGVDGWIRAILVAHTKNPWLADTEVKRVCDAVQAIWKSHIHHHPAGAIARMLRGLASSNAAFAASYTEEQIKQLSQRVSDGTFKGSERAEAPLIGLLACMLGTNVNMLTMSRNTTASHGPTAAGSPANTSAWLGKPASLAFTTTSPVAVGVPAVRIVDRGDSYSAVLPRKEVEPSPLPPSKMLTRNLSRAIDAFFDSHPEEASHATQRVLDGLMAKVAGAIKEAVDSGVLGSIATQSLTNLGNSFTAQLDQVRTLAIATAAKLSPEQMQEKAQKAGSDAQLCAGVKVHVGTHLESFLVGLLQQAAAVRGMDYSGVVPKMEQMAEGIATVISSTLLQVEQSQTMRTEGGAAGAANGAPASPNPFSPAYSTPSNVASPRGTWTPTPPPMPTHLDFANQEGHNATDIRNVSSDINRDMGDDQRMDTSTPASVTGLEGALGSVGVGGSSDSSSQHEAAHGVVGQ